MDKNCHICGKNGVSRVNGSYYLCQEHVDTLVMSSLKEGNPVLVAVQGEPKFMLSPELMKIIAGEVGIN